MHQQDIQAGRYYLIDVHMIPGHDSLKGTYLVLCDSVEDGVAVLIDTMGHLEPVRYPVGAMAQDDHAIPVSSTVALKAQAMALTSWLDRMTGMHRKASEKVDGKVTTH